MWKNHWLDLKADTHRLHGQYSLKTLILSTFFIRTFRVIATIRICKILNDAPMLLKIFLPLAKVLHKVACQLAGVDISWKTSIGRGFSIAHGWGIVINENSRIGNNVTLFHGVTLGRSDKIELNGVRSSGFPSIEDEVWIGPHAIIVGSIVIGRGSRVAGGAFVNKSATPLSMIVGNPMQVVKEGCHIDVMNPAPEY